MFNDKILFRLCTYECNFKEIFLSYQTCLEKSCSHSVTNITILLGLACVWRGEREREGWGCGVSRSFEAEICHRTFYLVDSIAQKIVMILFLMVAILQFALVKGPPGCWAGPTQPGKVCIDGNVLNGQISMDIRYTITSRFTHICCQALACTDFRGCLLKDIGCGQGTVSSQRLPWELRDINPLVRCYATDATNPDYYDFEVRVV
ncbi:insoluble matrix shell protein 3-like [Mercenaria mercenaria]|uniref:insoluble matrix shell protein 3-like n=1 Tax=Mercenaria mercenaria TaxID=6596 RepID=UPI00234F4C4F|nr:insoluble matrix shell protein 3-like [Mercenaria mercenaria]